ncbi:hypothetical protein O7606_20230 [Micromonospora sp. WMMD882]|uniref:hypothetical protein n=1 Tax=Micromonospora sp. WMMD882 TaxID=3015151 RepID=UPI00248C3A84|nr:hypothetical protein [Micromonospora sp. WMMD882]WBB78533.1 hypothetical protein O7606_20230 [Micromonospora sp. WMMD882]
MTPLDAQTPHRRTGKPRRPLLGVALAAVTIALTAAIAHPYLPGGHRPGAEPAVIPAGPGKVPPAAGVTAPCLAELADMLTTAADASRSANATLARPATYARTHTRAWAAQDTLIPSGTSSRTIVTTETWQWRAADGSGRTVSTTPGSAGHTVTDHPAGGIPAPLPEPTPTDPHTLTTHLAAVQPPGMGPQWIIRAVADVHLTQHPAPATRIALLRLLATADAVVCHGTTADRAGRPGIAVAVAHQRARDTLIIDRAGWVLAHESTDLGPPPGMDKNAPRLRSYTLVIDRSAEPTIDTAQATR